MVQLDHYTSRFISREFPITIVCNNISNAANIGSLFRAADAFGVKKIIFCGDDISMGRKMTKTSRSTEKMVNYSIETDIMEVIKLLKSQGNKIYSLEITTESKQLHTTKFMNEPMTLIIGDENFGISEELLTLSDGVFHIEMFGKNSSMNVVQATSVALYEITKQIM